MKNLITQYIIKKAMRMSDLERLNKLIVFHEETRRQIDLIYEARSKDLVELVKGLLPEGFSYMLGNGEAFLVDKEDQTIEGLPHNTVSESDLLTFLGQLQYEGYELPIYVTNNPKLKQWLSKI